MINNKRIVTEAIKLLGTPFAHFGRSSFGVDCSGLIYVTHTKSGIKLTRTDRTYCATWWKSQIEGERILEGFQKEWRFEICDEPLLGGLVLFRIFGKKAPVNHCGIIIDDTQFVHAKSGMCGIKDNKVAIDNYVNGGYAKRFVCFMKHGEVDYGNDPRTNNR